MFQLLIELLFTWLPSGLWVPVWAVLSVAFFVIMLKILTAIITIITSVFKIFVP